MGMFFLSENVFVTAYNRLVFSITSLHGLQNLKSSLSVNITALCIMTHAA